MLPDKKTGGGTAELAERPQDQEQDLASRQPLDGSRASLDGSSHGAGTLVAEPEAGSFRSRWEECQRSFVDEPRQSVQAADELVADLMRTLAKQFAATREGLESQWARGSDVSTEDLRVALQRYRDFFNRLLAV